MNIYICLIPHIAFKSEKCNRFFDVGFQWKTDPYKDLDGDFGSTGICRNYHKGSPQNIYHKYLQGEEVYFIYYCNKRSGDYFDTERKGLTNPDSVYITGILKIENSYENHRKAKEAGLDYENILSKNGYIIDKEKYYDKNEFRNPYLKGKWDNALLGGDWKKVNLMASELIDEFKATFGEAPIVDDRKLPRSYRNTGMWGKTTKTKLKKFLVNISK